MKVEQLTKLHKLLQKHLGDDLVYSLSLDNNEWYIVVAFSKDSTRKFKTGLIHRCKLSPADMNKHVYLLAQEIVNIFTPLIEKV